MQNTSGKKRNRKKENIFPVYWNNIKKKVFIQFYLFKGKFLKKQNT